MAIEVRAVNKDSSLEKQITLSILTSTEFLKRIRYSYNKDYFQNSAMALISYWAIEFFDNYGEAPKENIFRIFDVEKEDLDSSIIPVIEGVLQRVTSQQPDALEYILEKTKSYFEKRDLLLTARRMESLAERGLVDKAKEVRYDITKSVELVQDDFRDILDEHTIETALNAKKETTLFTFPGVVGNIIKPLRRGEFITFQGPGKRGKSWWLVYTAVQALYQRIPFVYFSLELPREMVETRIYQALTGFVDESDDTVSDKDVFPVFDCNLNQTDECARSERTCDVGLLLEDGSKPPFGNEDRRYIPCSSCRNHPELREFFEPAVWYERESRPDLYNTKNVKSKIRKLKTYLRACGVVESYPKASVTIEDIETRLNILEYERNFIPQVVIIDMLDNTAKTVADQRAATNHIWEYADRISKDRKILFVTANQGGRGAANKETQTEDDVFEDIRKQHHVDAMIAINQLKKEKLEKCWRIGMLAKRDGMFDSYHQALVLSNLSAGQVNLDSTFWFSSGG